jgi:hypothetical protein
MDRGSETEPAQQLLKLVLLEHPGDFPLALDSHTLGRGGALRLWFPALGKFQLEHRQVADLHPSLPTVMAVDEVITRVRAFAGGG